MLFGRIKCLQWKIISKSKKLVSNFEIYCTMVAYCRYKIKPFAFIKAAFL